MSPSDRQLKQEEMLHEIQNFVAKASGLRAELQKEGIVVVQELDQKGLRILATNLEEVLFRQHHHGAGFLQVNFCDSQKNPPYGHTHWLQAPCDPGP